MTEKAVQVEGLSKRYRIGAAKGPGALRRWWSGGGVRPDKQKDGQEAAADPRTLWALRDLDFEVACGEVLGVIGSNGAGKSTLLKILSQITSPTEGRAVIRGRVSSLLEVGTGFHRELTGRENIFLNGSILGMTKAEIQSKFDQIVDFSGVEKFIDTPVKRYSTGMGVRLAFSIAAHLEPEILIIDEVLSVGDADFQAKCLGRMEDVAGRGRTVLFVSHNMSAVRALCDRAIYLAGGRLMGNGGVDEVIDQYLSGLDAASKASLSDRRDRTGDGRFRFKHVKTVSADAPHAGSSPVTGETMSIEMAYELKANIGKQDVNIAALVLDRFGNPLFVCDTQLCDARFKDLPEAGVVVCQIPSLPLAQGRYRMNLWCAVSGVVSDYVINAHEFDVTAGDFFGTGRSVAAEKQGPFVMTQSWRLQI